jgi:hypothetical protein
MVSHKKCLNTLISPSENIHTLSCMTVDCFCVGSWNTFVHLQWTNYRMPSMRQTSDLLVSAFSEVHTRFKLYIWSSDFSFHFFHICVTSVDVYPLLLFIVTHCMFWPNWPFSGVEVVCLTAILLLHVDCRSETKSQIYVNLNIKCFSS